MVRTAWMVLAWALASGSQAHGLSNRVANTTLQMPEQPPVGSYTLSNAFANLSLRWPVGLVTPPDETNRLFILEQEGRIQVITNLAVPTQTLFMDLNDRAGFTGEEGLLALAFHPGYATNRYFYVWYTTGDNRQDRLSRFEVDPNNPARGLPDTEQILISQQDDAENHNGGTLLFGPDDGYLYLSIGDEGGSAAIDNVQRIDRDFFSGVFRIDVDKRPGSIPANPHPANTISGTINYAIPPDNPFIGITRFNDRPVNPDDVRTEFWAVGLRNPWRMSFDPQTRLLYAGDVGSTDTEEVNILTRGGNYGWNYFEGTNKNGGTALPTGYSPIFPIHEYNTFGGGGRLCIIGGVVYRGNRYSDLWGSYVFGDFVNGKIWSMRYEVSGGVTNIVPPVQIASSVNITSFGVDPSNGDILLTSHLDQRIKRLVRASSSGPSLPPTLADTGAFSDLANLTPQPGIVPYDLNVPFWSDHARKTRWFSVPNPNLVIGFNPTNNWQFPTGSVWIKHFDLQLTNGAPQSAKRLETRFIVRNEDGVYGLTYRWDSPGNATLVPDEGLNETFVINEGGGVLRTQVWRYPSRSECLQCHTPHGGLALGFNTAQLNRDFNYSGTAENQLAALSRVGYFNTPAGDPHALPVMAHATNSAFSVEDRVRSYLAANCVQCHQPGGTARGLWDARFSTPMSQANIIDGPLLDDLGNPANRVIKRGSIDESMMLTRLANWGSRHMPPLATSELNHEAIALLSRWITNDLVGANSPPVASTDTIHRYQFSGTRVLISTLLANDSDANGDTLSFVSVASMSTNGAGVSRDGEWIYYTPASGFTNDDAFTYQMTDNRSQPVTGTVNVMVTSDEVPSPNLTVTDLGNGSYRIRFDGIPDLTYRIEYTQTLNPPQWQTLGSRTADANGMFEIVDTPPSGFGQRFYRSVYP
jgi:glucose/arabinose dehydrogenase/mono/diheme cytochrome c family protein